MQEFAQFAGTQAAQGRVVLAHQGNGASQAAVRGGRSIDTSMGFTPSGGLPMGTRTGDLDRGVAWYLMQSENLTPEQFNRLINHESGLLGVSETSSDMRDLIRNEATDVRAAEAVELFCYQVRKWIGAYAAGLGRLDTLVFAGGHRDRGSTQCANASVISARASRVAVRVMHEEVMIAKSVCRVLNLPTGKEKDHGQQGENA